MSTAYHVVHYRRFEVTSDHQFGPSLEHLCRGALASRSQDGTTLWLRVQDRLCDLGDVFGGQLLLNRVVDLEQFLFGELCYVERRGLQALLQTQASQQRLSDLTLAEVFGLEERSAPGGSQFVRGLGYWLLTGDHIFIVRMQAMAPDRLHQYLNWLLKDCSHHAPPDLTFDLQAEFDKSVGDLGDIRKLRIGGLRSGALAATVGAQDLAGAERVTKTRQRVRDAELESEQARPIWDVVLGAARTSSFVEALGPGEYIAADTSLSIRGTQTAQTKRKLKELATDIANTSDAKVQVEGTDGRLSNGDAILRTTMPFNVGHEGGRLLDFDNVADQLIRVYHRYVEDGKIDA